jgi:hypothetical protein
MNIYKIYKIREDLIMSLLIRMYENKEEMGLEVGDQVKDFNYKFYKVVKVDKEYAFLENGDKLTPVFSIPQQYYGLNSHKFYFKVY